MFYTPHENPAVTLYNYWYNLLSAQGDLTVKSVEPVITNWWADNEQYPRVSYGAHRCGIGVSTFDAQQRPVIAYGKWYRRQNGIYRYLEVNADGEFRLVHPHGDNHDRIGHHTFLEWNWHGGQYVWFVSPVHGTGQAFDAKDWRTATPYLHERVIRAPYYYNHYNSPPEERRWLMLHPNDGRWVMNAAPDQPVFAQAIFDDKARVDRAYAKYRRLEVGDRFTAGARDGKTTLTRDEAVLRIAALLDVTQPAKAVRMSKTPREVNA